MLRKRGNIWYVALMRGGKRISRTTGLTDKAKARQVEDALKAAYGHAPRAAIDAWLDEIYNGTSGGVPVCAVWPRYCAIERASGRTLSDDTARRRESRWSDFAAWIEKRGITAVNRISRADAVDYARFIDDGKRSGKTRRNILSDVAKVWRGVAPEYKLQPIFDGLLPANDGERRGGFSRDEEARLMQAARTECGGLWHLPSMIARWTGLRLSSIRALTWGEVGADWVIRHTPPKTKAHGIAVAIPCAEELRDALEAEKPDGAKPDALVCPRFIDHHEWQEYHPFAAVMAAAGVPAVAADGGAARTFHSWRHTFATRLAEAGVGDDIARRLGGWRVEATRQRYDHAERVEELRGAIEATRGEVAGGAAHLV